MQKSCGGWVVRLVGYQLLRRALVVGVVLASGLYGPCSLAIPSAVAQERESPRAPASASEPIGANVDTDEGADSGVDGKPSGKNSSESLVSSICHAPAPILVVTIVIAVMSFYLMALVFWMAIHYRTPAAVPAELIRDVQILLEQNKFNEAYHRLVQDTSFLARVLASGVRKLPSGVSHGLRAMELTNEDITMEMEHRTTYLATVGTLGPMIGLVGTVYGMIMAFHVIASEGSSPQASALAAGISTALYATLEGIAISIPAIFFYAMYRNRIARLSLEVGMTAEPLLEQFVPGVRSVGANPAANYIPAATTPAAHPHPFALSATLAATGGNVARPALPSTD